MTWQPTAVEYPNSVLVTATLLRTLLTAEGETGLWVGSKLPTTRPTRAVQVLRDGGPIANLRDTARMRLLIWDTTDQRVDDLTRLVIALLPRMCGQSGVLRIGPIFGPVEIPDAAPKRQVNAEIEFRGEAL